MVRCVVYVIGILLMLTSTSLAQVNSDSSQVNDTVLVNSSYLKLKKAFDLIHEVKNSEAFIMAHEVLKVAYELQNDSLKARSYNVLGISSIMRDANDDKALEYLNKSFTLYEKLLDTARMAMVYNNLALYHKHRDEYDVADAYYEKGLELIGNSKDRKSLARKVVLYYNIAYTNYKNEHYQKTISYLNKSLEIRDKTENKILEGNIYWVFGWTYLKLKDYEKAHHYFDKAIGFSEKMKNLDLKKDAYDGKIEVFTAQNNFKNANNYLLKIRSINDSLNKVLENDKIKKIEYEYAIKDREKKIALIEKEAELQRKSLKFSNVFNFALVSLSIILLVFGTLLLKKNKEVKMERDRANKLSKAKSNFYSEISHELRTPLYAVIELSGVLLKGGSDFSSNTKYLKCLKFSGNHLLSLINNVLEFNKKEKERIRIDSMEFNLKELIENILDSLEYALKENKNTLKLSYDESIPQTIVGDSLKLTQIMMNLITNAIKYTNNGQIDVEVKVLKDGKEEIEIYFCVSDDGLGILKDEQEKIFKTFYREKAKSSNSSYKGTGLGLSIVKQLLEALNSGINLESEPNMGAKFYFKLDFVKGKEETGKGTDRKFIVEELEDKLFLIVDDNKINQIVTKKVLNQLGLKCNVVGSGQKAIEAVKEVQYDCILMDLHMPEIDGYETSNKIRAFNKDVGIVALTAASGEEVKAKINECDMDGYVLKPYYTSNLLKAMVEAMSKRRRLPL